MYCALYERLAQSQCFVSNHFVHMLLLFYVARALLAFVVCMESRLWLMQCRRDTIRSFFISGLLHTNSPTLYSAPYSYSNYTSTYIVTTTVIISEVSLCMPSYTSYHFHCFVLWMCFLLYEFEMREKRITIHIQIKATAFFYFYPNANVHKSD